MFWKRPYLALIGAAMLLFLQACMLASGERASTDIRPDAGNVTRTFLGSEGSEVYAVSIGDGEALLQVIAILELQQGEMRLELLNAGGSVAFAVQSRPGDQVSRSGMVRLDENGVLRYRVVARGARDGGYQILYQRAQKNQ